MPEPDVLKFAKVISRRKVFRFGSCFFNIRDNFINSRALRGAAYDGDVKRSGPKSLPATRRRKLIFAAVLAVVFLWTASPARPYRPVEPIPAGIVDMHCHLAGIGAGEPVRSRLPECGSAAQTVPGQASVHRKEILWK